VGKTTTSCSLSLQFARNRAALGQKVLLISTDPAHNLSDAFQQKITDQPTQIQGVANLFAMETDPDSMMNKQLDAAQLDLPDSAGGGARASGDDNPLAALKNLAKNLPGIDEAMSFNQLMTQVKSMEYNVVVFDTAPTGHTLRLLSLPQTLEASLGGLMNQSGPLGAMMSSMQGLFGGADPKAQMRAMSEKVKEVADIFKDATKTTFVCVCIPEFLSVFETERLIQELAKFEIDCSNIVVNQIVYPEPGTNCGLCHARSAMQGKYLAQIDELYEDFHVVKMPLLHSEVRGVKDIEAFSKNLLTQFVPKKEK
jgi:arsenite/tail-anchored protein-transporting ATPase